MLKNRYSNALPHAFLVKIQQFSTKVIHILNLYTVEKPPIVDKSFLADFMSNVLNLANYL